MLELAAALAASLSFNFFSACLSSSALIRVTRANYSIYAFNILVISYHKVSFIYLFGVVKTFEIIIALCKALLGEIGTSIALVEFLPEMKASAAA